MPRCNFCGGKKVSDLYEHCKRQHIGKMSEESVRYLLSLGVPYFCILEAWGK